jgi:hypothetical protein
VVVITSVEEAPIMEAKLPLLAKTMVEKKERKTHQSGLPNPTSSVSTEKFLVHHLFVVQGLQYFSILGLASAIPC